jgi:RNA polymerase primary sigma factor
VGVLFTLVKGAIMTNKPHRELENDSLLAVGSDFETGGSVRYSAPVFELDEEADKEPSVAAEEVIGPYFKEMKNIPLLKYEDEQRLGKRIKDAQEGLLKKALRVKTTFMPLRAFRKTLRQWKKKQKNSREPIEFILAELDRVLVMIDGLDRPTPEVVTFGNEARALLHEMYEAMGEMVESNLRLAVSIAKRYARRGMPLADLIQEGNLGLMKAVARFDYTTGNRFSTFASWWIRQTISRALSDQGRTIRVPIHFQEVRNQFYRSLFELIKEMGREPTPGEIAEHSGLSMEKILTIVQMNREPLSLDMPVTEDGDMLGDLIENADCTSPLEAAVENEILHLTEEALESLNDRERKILSMRFGLGDNQASTLEEVGAYLNISRERVRQLEKRAMNRLRHSSERRNIKGYFTNN